MRVDDVGDCGDPACLVARGIVLVNRSVKFAVKVSEPSTVT